MPRFPQLDDRGFAEYYLLGTLASVTVAIISGLLASAALSTLWGRRRGGYPRQAMTAPAAAPRTAWPTLVLCGVLAVVAGCAVFDLGLLVTQLAAAFPERMGPQGLAFTGGVLAVALAGVAVALRAGRSRRDEALAVASGLALLVGLRVAFIAVVDAPLIADWLRYHQLALQVLDGGSLVSDRPMGLPVLMAAVYGIAGVDPRYVELVNLGAALLTGLVVHRVARRAWGPAAGAVGLTLYAVAPAQVIMTSLFSTETLYGLMLAVVVGLVAGTEPARALAGAFVLSFSQLVRTTSIALAPVTWFLAVRWRRPGQRAAVAGLLAVVGLVLGLLPVIIGTTVAGRPSVSSSSYVWWTLYIGANQETGGKWNEADIARVGGVAGTPEADRLARQLALERIGGDPLGTAVLYVRKIPTTWGDARYAARWVFLAMPEPDARAVGVSALLSSVGWAATTTLAAIGAWLERRRPARATVLVAAIVGSMVLAHAVLEASARFHDPTVPILSMVAGAGLARLVDARRSRVT